MRNKRQGRPRISEEEIAEMLRLRRQQKSVAAISRETGHHRQTITAYLKERQTDMLADEIRKQVLIEELRHHFEELVEFATTAFRRRFDVSPSETSGMPFSALIKNRPILVSGLLALPGQGSPTYVVQEWTRMYLPPSKERYLEEALREHTNDSHLWDYVDTWRIEVAHYEDVTKCVLRWIDDKMETERERNLSSEDFDRVRTWLFGNILLKASGTDYAELETHDQQLTTPGEREVVARATEGGTTQALRDWLTQTLEEAEKLPEWTRKIKTGIIQLKEKQSKLRELVLQIDPDLERIGLMRAFRGRCKICPV